MTLRTLNYGNYGIFLIMGHAGFCPSTVGPILALGAIKSGAYKGRSSRVFVGLRVLGFGFRI